MNEKWVICSTRSEIDARQFTIALKDLLQCKFVRTSICHRRTLRPILVYRRTR